MKNSENFGDDNNTVKILQRLSISQRNAYSFSFQIPRAVIEPTLFTTLIFLVAGLHGGFMGWLGFNFVCILCANYANAYGMSKYIVNMPSLPLCIVPSSLPCLSTFCSRHISFLCSNFSICSIQMISMVMLIDKIIKILN